MAYNETLAGILRDQLATLDGVTERRIFGGLCFMLNGNMLCGVDKNGGMARVGKEPYLSTTQQLLFQKTFGCS